MNLAQWLGQDRSRTNRWLAEQCGVTPEAVRLWRAAQRMPSGDAVTIIYRLTDGQVTDADMQRAYADNKR